MTSTVQWNLLGEDTVLIDGGPVSMPNRSRSVLLALLADANRPVSVDRLADALWGDDQPKSPKNSLSRFVVDLRRSLGPFADRISSQPGSYRVDVHAGELDTECVEAAVETARTALKERREDLGPVINELHAASEMAGLRPNRLIEELNGFEVVERVYTELRIGTTEALAEALLREEQYVQLIPQLERAIDQHPYHENFWYLLMRGLDGAGRPLEATRAADRLRTLLAEIGVAPIDKIVELENEIRTRDVAQPASSWSEASAVLSTALRTEPDPPGTAVESSAHDIANPGTSLVGRADEIRELHRLAGTERLVSIVGLGGSGKTRVALALADLLEAGGDSVFRVGLRQLHDASSVVPVVAKALGVPDGNASDPIALAKTLAPHSFTLVLDNCEHLRDTCCDVIDALIRYAPSAQVILTSRELLEIAGEAVYFLRPLAFAVDPNDALATTPAADLFVERAGTKPSDLCENDHRVIGEICRLLGGLPLAIEIAAAQLAYMSPPELLERVRLARTDADSSSEPAVSAMADVLDWTWSSLSPSQQALFARLSIFDSGWTVESAEAVRASPGSIDADLARLVSSCLVLRGDYRGGTRYEILPSIREFAAARLADRGETQIMQERMAAWAKATVSKHTFLQYNLWSPATNELLPEHGNLLAVCAYLQEQDRYEELVTLVANAGGMMINSGLSDEAIAWLRPFLDHPDLSDRARSAAHASLSAALHTVGELEQLGEIAVRGIELADGEPHDWIPVLAGYFAVWSLVAPVAIPTEQLMGIALRAAQRGPTKRTNLCVVATYKGYISLLSRRYEDSLEKFRVAKRLSEHPGRGLMVIEIGETLSLYLLGRHGEARQSVDDWISRSDTDHWHYILDVVRAVVLGGTGDPERATAELAEAVRVLPEAKAWGRAGIVQTAFAMLADFRGEPELAEELFSSAVNPDIMLLTVAIEHVIRTRGLDGDEAWREVGLEFWTRIVPEGSAAATAQTTPQLLSWWTSGARPE